MRAAGRALAAVLSAALILASAPESAWARVGRLAFARPLGRSVSPAAAPVGVLAGGLPRAAVPVIESISEPIAQMSAEALHLESAPGEDEKAAPEANAAPDANATPDAESSVAGASRHFDLSAQSGRAADPPPAATGAVLFSRSPGVSLSLRGLVAGRGRGVVPAASKGASLDRLSWSLRLFWRDPAVRLSVLWVLGIFLTAFLTLPTVHLLSLPPARVLSVLIPMVLGTLLVGLFRDGRIGLWASLSLPFLLGALFALFFPWRINVVLCGLLPLLAEVFVHHRRGGRPVRSLRRAALRTLDAFRGADVERIALGLAASREESRQALAELAESSALSSAFGPALVEESKSSWKRMELEDASLFVQALSGANDSAALERLKVLNLSDYQTSWPGIQQFLDETIASLPRPQEIRLAGLARAAEALKTLEGDPLGEQAREAALSLRRRAEAFLQIAGGGWLESKQREAVVLALKDLDAAASADERAIAEARLEILLADETGYPGSSFFWGARGRFAYPWGRSAAHSIAAFIEVLTGFEYRDFYENIPLFAWIAAFLVGLSCGHVWLGLLGGVALGIVISFTLSSSSIQEMRFFRSLACLGKHKPERVSEASNAAAYALSRAFPDAVRLKLEKEIQDLIDNRHRTPHGIVPIARSWRWPAHPFLALVSADEELREAVWERFGSKLVARAPAAAAETIAAARRGGGDWSAAELRVLSEAGFWGRQTLAQAIETGFFHHLHYKAVLEALVSNIELSGGVSAEETPRLRALFKKYEYDAPEALQALERVAVPAALEILAPGSFASEAEALLARARSWLTLFVPGDHVDVLRSREVQDGIRALEEARAGGDEDGGAIALARLGRLLGASRGAGK